VDHFLLLGLERTLTILDKFVGPETLFVGFSTTFMNLSTEHVGLEKAFDFTETTREGGGANAINFTYGVPITDSDLDAIREKIIGINPNTKLVMGGTKADFLSQAQIDTFVIGYADNVIVDYAKFLQGKNPFLQYSSTARGQMILDKDVNATGHDFVNSQTEFHETDLIRPEEVLPIEISRGCIFRCKFCSFPLIGKKKNDHIKNKDIIYAEMMRNYEKFGTTKYVFADDTYNESVEKLAHFAEAFARLPFKIEFVTYLRHDLIYRFPEMADLLKESGLKAGMFGLETLNHAAGKIIGKGLHPDKTREILTWLREDKGWKNNILLSSGFILGLPGETRDTISEWAEELTSFKYPLDSFNFFALAIGKPKKYGNKSEFENNFKDYGYYFDPAKSTSWINEHWRFEDAVYMADVLHNYIHAISRSKTHGFYSMMLQNFGYTWEDIHSNSWKELIKRQDVFKHNIIRADEYYDKLIKL